MANLTFRHDRAECPELEDDMYVLLKDGVDTHVAIQDAHRYGGGYAINRYYYVNGQLEASQFLSEHRSLKAAKEAALKLV